MLNKRKKARKWAKHCTEIQNALNQNNWERFGWYVSRGEMVYDWRIYIDKGKGLILKYDQI